LQTGSGGNDSAWKCRRVVVPPVSAWNARFVDGAHTAVSLGDVGTVDAIDDTRAVVSVASVDVVVEVIGADGVGGRRRRSRDGVRDLSWVQCQHRGHHEEA